MTYFNYDINGWDDWCKVFDSLEAFEPLVRHIQPDCKQVSNLTPGTNAVFKADDKVVKIFVPEEAGFYCDMEFNIEKYGLSFADSRGISVPKLITSGVVYDKYKFRYMVMDHIKGEVFDDIGSDLTDADKYNIGKRFADIKKKLNVPCDKFCDIDIIDRAINDKRWDKYPKSFNAERIKYLQSYTLGDPVFVHGDINPDNVIFGDDGVMYLIDFADACIAPAIYELAPLICCFFECEKPYLDGYGEFDPNNLFDSLLMHDFGGDIITDNFGTYDEFTSLDVLREKIEVKLCRR